MKRAKRIFVRAVCLFMTSFILLSLTSCFSYRGNFFGDIEATTSPSEVNGTVSSEYDRTVELSNGIELTLSADGTHYRVTSGVDCTDSVAAIPASFNGIPVEVIDEFGKNEIMETLLLPESIIQVDEHAFDNCPNLKYNEYGNAKYLGSGDNEHFVLISADNTSIPSVDIHPKTLIIADYAFGNCKELTKVVFPDSLKIIGDYAFMSCDKLTEIVFGNSLESIGSHAFAYLDSLKSVEIPDSVTYLGQCVFYKCTSLESVVIGDGLEEISYMAFQFCSSLTDIEFGNSVKVLKEYAFADCTSLSELRLPGTVDTVYYRAFKGCTHLKYNYYGKELLYLPGENSDYEYLISFVYYSFESARLHPETRVISLGCFGILPELRELTIDGEGKYLTSSGNCIIDKESKTLIAGINTSVIPDDGSIEAIGDHAFRSMDEFTMTSIPAGVKSIGDNAFLSCSALVSVELNPELESLGENAFAHCSLSSITFGDRIESIGDYAFNGNSITELYLPGSLRELGEGAFQLNEKLVYLEIADGLTKIGRVAFGHCSALGNVILPETLEYIEFGAFRSCTSLESIDLPDRLKYVGQFAFVSTALTNVVLPDGLQVIDDGAFKSHTIVSITVNRGIASIGQDAFVCGSLESVSYRGTTEEWQKFTAGVYDMFNEGDTMTVKCSDGELECLGVMNIPSSNLD